MKIAVFGISDFTVGKKILSDERLDKLSSIFHSPKTTYIQLEFVDSSHLQSADGILASQESKLDLAILDLEIIEKILPNVPESQDLFLRCKQALEKEILLNEINLTDEEKKLLANYNPISLRPIYFASPQELKNIPEAVQSTYKTLGMISFFTVNEKELRAWPIKNTTTAIEAAGLIHSDIQRGFIKAEVIGYEDLIKSGGINQAKSAGLMRLEDKNYIIKDADLIKFRFNV